MRFLIAVRKPSVGKLFAIRWTGQLTDGIFQSALASFVLFSPERQPDAKSAAIAFAVVLLPYSVIGPLVGTILDRFSRQRIFLFANLFRAMSLVFIGGLVRNGSTGVELTILVLLAFGVNRLILAGLSAALPLLFDTRGLDGRNTLVSINAVAVTGGTVFVVIGGGIGIGIRNLINFRFEANQADAILIFLAATGFVLAGLFALLLKKGELGPLPHEVKRETIAASYREMSDGFRVLRSFRDCFLGITATAVQRGGLTALTLMALLLNRNTYNNPSDPEAGLGGFALAISIAGAGIMLGALIAPFGVAQFGRHEWIRISLLVSAALPLVLAISQSQVILLATGFFTGLAGQNIKVANDALIQSTIADEYRGRTFAIYDVIVNGGIVCGAIIAALILPPNGVSSILPLVIALVYILFGARLLRKANFNSDYLSTT